MKRLSNTWGLQGSFALVRLRVQRDWLRSDLGRHFVDVKVVETIQMRRLPQAVVNFVRENWVKLLYDSLLANHFWC